MNKILLFLFTLSIFQSQGQVCETYDRELFHMLPKSFPDSINCKDLSQQKQGLWLQYKIAYNPVDKPDELKKGHYVPSYSYGRYLNDRKIGIWKHVNNVHSIFVSRTDSIFYINDSVTIFTDYVNCGFINHLLTQIDADSTKFRFTHHDHFSINHPVIFDCDLTQPEAKQCKKLYREVEIKEFPFDYYGMEADRIWFEQREIRLIDEKLDKSSDE